MRIVGKGNKDGTKLIANISQAWSVNEDDVVSLNTQTSTPYSLVLSDASKNVRMNLAGVNTVNVPLNSSVAFPVGTLIQITQSGAGLTTVDGAAGVTVNGVSGGTVDCQGQYKPVTLQKVGTDEWEVYGGA